MSMFVTSEVDYLNTEVDTFQWAPETRVPVWDMCVISL